jgi:hypothetical protein
MRDHDSRQPLAVAAVMAATVLTTLVVLLAIAGFVRVERAAEASMMEVRR